MREIFRYTFTFLLSLLTIKVMAQGNVVQYVDPFIGTENSGNVFPGASLPFGMVRLSPDCRVLIKGKAPNTNSGYVSKAPVYGFSHTHVSGTGGGAKYGNILFMPTVGKINLKNHESTVSNETAHAGYYSATLDQFNIKVELSATHSVGFHRYTFPANDSANVIMDATSFLVKGSTVQKLVNSGICITSDSTLQGFGTVSGGWNEGAPYTVYFYAVFDKPAISSKTWLDGKLGDQKEIKPDGKPMATGAVFTFKTAASEQVNIKVGISFISTEKAKQNLEKEGAGYTFDQARQAASTAWNNLLKRIEVKGAKTDKIKFYTALYHVMLMPSDRTGENPLWLSDEPYYDDYYAIWDTFRASNPLITLIDQKRQEDIIRSLLDIYKHEGYMPDARSGNYNGLMQGGTNSDILIADAYLKGLKNIDYSLAYEAMVKNAEIAPKYPKKEGREGIADYKQLGFVPYGTPIAGSRTVEYAYNDAVIAGVAEKMGKLDDAKKYNERASNWQNLWRPILNHGATGFIWPKNRNGAWEDDFDVFKKGTFKGFLYEGDSWTYSLYVPHDVKKLVELSGGKEAFIERLDTFFVNKYFNVNNEPGFLTPCLYSWVGRPDKVAERVNIIRNSHYGINRGGLPGNDDSGAMSAWFAMHALGFYPNAGQDVYLITAPLFKQGKLHLKDEKILLIKASGNSKKKIYIQSATLNGKVWDKAWFRHSDIINGGILKLVMGKKPSNWGSKDLPPSLSDTKPLNKL